jgi:hypothetical protein
MPITGKAQEKLDSPQMDDVKTVGKGSSTTRKTAQ